MPFLGKTPQQFVDPEVDIDGGSIDGTAIGATSASTATVTTFTSTGIDDNATGTAITIDSSQNVSLSGDLTVDTNTLYVDSTNNRVGIGTTTPDEFLYVQDGDIKVGKTSNDFGVLHLGNTSDQTKIVGRGGSHSSNPNTMLFFTDNTERITIDSSQNVGIGTTTLNSKLNIAGSIAALNTGPASRTDILVCAHDYYSAPSYRGVLSVYNGTSSTGTTYGITNANLGSLRFQNVGHGLIGTNGSAPLVFATLSTERMRIDSSGNLLVGKTSGASSIRTQFVGASSTSSNSVMLLENSSLTDLFEVRCDGRIMTGTATASPYNQTVSFGANLWINSSGVLYRTTSSLRYKENIQDMTFGLSEVLALRPVTFEQKNENTGRKFGGFIAEEVHEAGLVDFVEYNEENEPDAISYGNMVSLLTKAIQEQQAIIDSQASAIADLTARLEALEAN